MAADHVICVDLAKVYSEPVRETGDKCITVLGWGDPVEIEEQTATHLKIKFTRYKQMPDGSVLPEFEFGFIRPSQSIAVPDIVVPRAQDKTLRVDFVDVQQGDAALIETASGKTVLVDGGDNQLFARYLASRFPLSTEQEPKEIDCIVVTHGDADHFAGLTAIHESESYPTRLKQLFINPHRVFHNGLVKRPDKKAGKKRPEAEMLGNTVKDGNKLIVTELETDLLQVESAKMNKPFKAWKAALQAYASRRSTLIEFKRLAKGDDLAFDFLSGDGLQVEVLGPILSEANGAQGLLFLGRPKDDIRIGLDEPEDEGEFSGKSASHTINGHSIIVRLTFGKFRFLLTGDLNEQASRALVKEHRNGTLSLEAEVFKVPHHGSGDFSASFIKAVSPVVSVVSSGDETARKEYVHPRATIMGALGRFSRIERPLVFVTELVAFFELEGWVRPEWHTPLKEIKESFKQRRGSKAIVRGRTNDFFAFSRTVYGIVRVRTDGERLLVYTNSGQVDMKEAYAFVMDSNQKVKPVPLRTV